MARHAASPQRRRTLARAGLTVAAAGAALGAGSAAAQAATVPETVGAQSVVGPDARVGAAPLATLTGVVTRSVDGLGELRSLPLNPLANTGVDPLDNTVATQVADFKPVSTAVVTDNLTRGQALEDLPVAGPLANGVLP
ncbi:hypothetical protein AB0K02_20385 [Streptomyces sp. NPDC049597]|uniref:hypothetical protein n=1 Tax=Streptomyces sp. NPDC049597 TaxID=3155276 RepID=UPI00342FEED2